MIDSDLRQSSDTVDDQTVASQCASLVKTADVHFAGKWNSERLRTEHV